MGPVAASEHVERENPHRERGRRILARQPEMRALFGSAPSTSGSLAPVAFADHGRCLLDDDQTLDGGVARDAPAEQGARAGARGLVPQPARAETR